MITIPHYASLCSAITKHTSPWLFGPLTYQLKTIFKNKAWADRRSSECVLVGLCPYPIALVETLSPYSGLRRALWMYRHHSTLLNVFSCLRSKLSQQICLFFWAAAMRPSHSPHLCSFLLLPQKGQTALMRASQNGHYNVVEKLISAGAQTDIQDKVRNVVTMVTLIQVPNEHEVATLVSF